jgi:hypothetical protein
MKTTFSKSLENFLRKEAGSGRRILCDIYIWKIQNFLRNIYILKSVLYVQSNMLLRLENW